MTDGENNGRRFRLGREPFLIAIATAGAGMTSFKAPTNALEGQASLVASQSSVQPIRVRVPVPGTNRVASADTAESVSNDLAQPSPSELTPGRDKFAEYFADFARSAVSEPATVDTVAAYIPNSIAVEAATTAEVPAAISRATTQTNANEQSSGERAQLALPGLEANALSSPDESAQPALQMLNHSPAKAARFADYGALAPSENDLDASLMTLAVPFGELVSGTVADLSGPVMGESSNTQMTQARFPDPGPITPGAARFDESLVVTGIDDQLRAREQTEARLAMTSLPRPESEVSGAILAGADEPAHLSGPAEQADRPNLAGAGGTIDVASRAAAFSVPEPHRQAEAQLSLQQFGGWSLAAANKVEVPKKIRTSSASRLHNASDGMRKHRLTGRGIEFSIPVVINGQQASWVPMIVDPQQNVSMKVHDLLALVEPLLPPETYSRLAGSQSAQEYVTLRLLRSQGIDFRYDAAHNRLVLGES